MKLFFLCLSSTLILTGCGSSPIGFDRYPSSVPTAVSKAANDVRRSNTTTLQTFLKYQIIKNSSFERIDTQDCKAYAQQSQSLCKSDECKAVLGEQEFRCSDSTCKALVALREDLCTDEACRAIVTNQPEKCKQDDKLCLSVINQEASKCTDDNDCRAYVENNPAKCKTNQCKGILNENISLCGESTPTDPATTTVPTTN